MNSFLLHIPYVKLLPEETLTPLHFTKEELQLLQSTPLYGHAIESRRNGRKSCIKAVKWLLSHHLKANDEVDKLVNLLQIPQGMLNRDETDNAADLSREVENWGVDEEEWSILSIWRWVETAYGR